MGGVATSERTRIRFAPAWVRIQADNPDWRHSAPPYSFKLLAAHGFGPNGWLSRLWNKSGSFGWLGAGGQIAGENRLDLRLAWRSNASGVPLEVALIVRRLLGGDAEFDSQLKTEPQAPLQLRAGF
ncbi:MAG: hypothetical protein B7Y50_06190 [Hydrogenophilales bacterium 28-61-11]|nr:MAG: hypothetical protein B7Y50_06190 [Hydrogenophilales bacterium 28-61-11]OYZ56568.1 MAG: hypothetical protein B7Y21_10925 [Hydrogenophilales bacterium 16-61-112]OZA45676.1 MAG: hypothetical protein B7X81_07865 [Hydrogenophilales bacterium 17-61-76]